MAPRLESITVERWPIAGTFRISRGAKSEAVVVVATVGDGRHLGRGEAVPYARYGESVERVVAAIEEAASGPLGLNRHATAMPPGAARNALDCALIDLAAKASGRSAARQLGLSPPTVPRLTCYTLSLDAPDAMARAARQAATMPLLKLKLGGGMVDAERLRAVRNARPDAFLVADANEAWSHEDLPTLLAVSCEIGLAMLEQPLPAGGDAVLASIDRRVPICADESAHTATDIACLCGRYDAVNIKLDKAGGLTAAAAMAHAAKAAGLRIMVGCMVATSLAMTPAWHLAGLAEWLDLDGPLLLARDRMPGLHYADGQIFPPAPGLWG